MCMQLSTLKSPFGCNKAKNQRGMFMLFLTVEILPLSNCTLDKKHGRIFWGVRGGGQTPLNFSQPLPESV